MIRGLLYEVECDICASKFGRTDSNQFRIEDEAREWGWKFRRRKDGEYARRGGRDYCPRCIPATWTAAP